MNLRGTKGALVPISERVTSTRKRSIPFRGSIPDSWGRMYEEYWDGGKPSSQTYRQSNASVIKSLTGTQVTVSENHPGWRRVKQRSLQDMGGPFESIKKSVIVEDTMRELFGTVKDGQLRKTSTFSYKGPLLPTNQVFNSNLFPPNSRSTDAQLDAFGTTAIARCKPQSAHANLANALIELKREGLPKLVGASSWQKSVSKARKGTASELLNVEFGYKPLANDIADVAMVVHSADDLIRQYRRDAGKIVRRRFEFPPVVSESETVYLNNCSPDTLGVSNLLLYNVSSMNQGRVMRTRKTSRNVWFSGAFTYHLPIDPITMREVDDRYSHVERLLGIELTPDVLWNATPWSWAVDWVSNIGDIISNVQSWTKDGFVMKWGYVMEHSFTADTYTFVGKTGLRSSARPAQVTFVNETKVRRKATPFGFGSKYGSFTNRQWAIIAALGLSR